MVMIMMKMIIIIIIKKNRTLKTQNVKQVI